MSKRPYTRCRGCGEKYPAARKSPLCPECNDGQTHLWPLPYAPVEFVPLPLEGTSARRRLPVVLPC